MSHGKKHKDWVELMMGNAPGTWYESPHVPMWGKDYRALSVPSLLLLMGGWNCEGNPLPLYGWLADWGSPYALVLTLAGR